MFKEYTFMIGSDEPETGIISNVLSTSFGESGLYTRLQGSMAQLGKYLALYVVRLFSLFFLENTYRWLAGFNHHTLYIAVGIVPWLLHPQPCDCNAFLILGQRDLLYCSFRMGLWKSSASIVPKTALHSHYYHCCTFSSSGKFPHHERKLNVTQVTLQKQLFSKSLDENLYSYFGDEDLSHVQIATNYPVAFLPGFENAQIKFSFNELQVLPSCCLLSRGRVFIGSRLCC